MADNFLQAINTGINLGHMADSAKMQRAQMERMAQQMQMEGIERAMKLQTFVDAQAEKANRKVMYAPESIGTGGDEYTGPMAERIPGGPGREALRAVSPDNYGVLADQMLNFGKVDPGLATMLKPVKPTQDQYKVVGGNLIDVTKDPTKPVYTAPQIDKEQNVPAEIDTFLSQKFNKYFQDKGVRERALAWYATPEGSAQYNAFWDKRKQTGQPFFAAIPGYQTPDGRPIMINAKDPNAPASIPGAIQKTPSESDIKEARTKTTMDAVIDEFQNAFALASSSMPNGAAERVTGYPGRMAGTIAQTDPSLTLAKNLSDGFLAKFARAAGEVGTLTDQDIARAKQLVPSIHDVPEVRQGKMDKMRALATEIYERGKRQPAPLGNMQGAAPKGPRIGEVVDGHRFMGGNPADQKSWKKVGK